MEQKKGIDVFREGREMAKHNQSLGRRLGQRLFMAITRKSSLHGFTLLELMIVVIILGVLSAVAIPVFLGQVGKARESESLLLLGSMARSQQSYHYLQGEFALTLADLENQTGPISSKYHDVDNIAAGVMPNSVTMQIIALNPGRDQVRDYAVGIYFNNGAYLRSTCQGAVVGAPVQVGPLPTDPCTNGGFKIY